MRQSSYKPAKVFTIDEANAMLPLVSAITADLAKLSKEILERHHRLAELTRGRDLESGDPYDDELAQIHEELEKDKSRLNEYVDELRALGVEPKDGPMGLVDFPGEMEGRPVYLCWKLGEPEVMFWHEIDAGFAGRKPFELETAESSGGDATEGSVF